jgi:hypothetical protein
MASGQTIPVVKDARVELTIQRRTLMIWVFAAHIADEFILGLDILRAYDTSVYVGRHVLRLGRDEVPVGEAPTASEVSSCSQHVHCNDLDILFVESFQPLVAVEESQLLLTTSFLGNSGHRK